MTCGVLVVPSGRLQFKRYQDPAQEETMHRQHPLVNLSRVLDGTAAEMDRYYRVHLPALLQLVCRPTCPTDNADPNALFYVLNWNGAVQLIVESLSLIEKYVAVLTNAACNLLEALNAHKGMWLLLSSM